MCDTKKIVRFAAQNILAPNPKKRSYGLDTKGMNRHCFLKRKESVRCHKVMS